MFSVAGSTVSMSSSKSSNLQSNREVLSRFGFHSSHSDSKSQSQKQSNYSQAYHASNSSKQCHSSTNSSRRLVISNKHESPKPKTSFEEVEEKVFTILSGFNETASVMKVAKTTIEIMKVFAKYDKVQRPHSSNTKTKKSDEMVSEIPIRSHSLNQSHAMVKPKQLPSNQQPKQPLTIQLPKSKLKHCHQTMNVSCPIACKERKIPKELMCLVSSDGFVDTPPRNHRRMSIAVNRFDETKLEQQSSKRKRVKRKSIEKKSIRPHIPKYTSFPQYKPFTVIHQEEENKTTPTHVESSVNRTVTTSTTVSKVLQHTMQSQSQQESHTTPAPVSFGNFIHNNIRITHFPMIEVKIEPVD